MCIMLVCFIYYLCGVVVSAVLLLLLSQCDLER